MSQEVESGPTARLIAETLNTDLPPEVEARMRSRLDALRIRFEGSVAPVVHSRRPRRWLVGVTAIAAFSAAVLLAIALLPIGSSPALADLVEAVAAKPWLHAIGTGPDGKPAEMWFSAKNGVLAWHAGESFLFVDQEKGMMDVFGKPADSDAVQRIPLENVPFQGVDAARQSFLALLTGDLQRAMKAGDQNVLEHQQQTIAIAGRLVTEHRFVVGQPGQDGARIESVLHVDPQTGLPVSWRMKARDRPLGDFSVSYPERGPLTIVALGVPESIEIVDRTPSGEFKNVLVATNAARRRFDDYHAVVIDSPSADRATHGTWSRIWRKGNRWRIDRGHRMFHKDEVPPEGVDPETWWLEKAESMRSYPREIWDGKRLWTFEPIFPNPRRVDDADPHAVAIDSLKVSSRALMDPNDPASNSGVTLPEYFGYASLNRGASLGFQTETRTDILNEVPMTVVDILRPFDKSPKSISPERYWLDPQRGGMIVRMEWFLAANPGQSTGATEVTSAARTRQGLWYPTTVRHIGNSISLEDGSRSDWYDRYYLEFDTDIPDELFRGEAVDPKSFWSVVK